MDRSKRHHTVLLSIRRPLFHIPMTTFSCINVFPKTFLIRCMSGTAISAGISSNMMTIKSEKTNGWKKTYQKKLNKFQINESKMWIYSFGRDNYNDAKKNKNNLLLA